MATSKNLNDYTLTDFKNLAKSLEKEYKNHTKVVELNQLLHSECKKRKYSLQECNKMVPEIILILEQIWGIKFSSKKNILTSIVSTVDKTKPLAISKEQETAMTTINNMNHQHDMYTATQQQSAPLSKQKIEQINKQSKQLVSNINQNYNNYHNIWNKLKTIETQYVTQYKEYYSYKNKYKNDTSKIPPDIKTKLTSIYKYLTTTLIPEFKKLNLELDNIIVQRTKLLEQFYNLYLNLSPSERSQISIPLTAFDAYKKLHTPSGSEKPKTNVKSCIQKSWADAIKQGFNLTFYAPCNVVKQHEIVPKCSSKYDWPYIAYSPNMYQPWSPKHDIKDWMKSCIAIEHYERPYIGI